MSKLKNKKITSALSFGAVSALMATSLALPAFAAVDVTGTWGDTSYTFNEDTNVLSFGANATATHALGTVANAPWADTGNVDASKVKTVKFLGTPEKTQFVADSHGLFSALTNLIEIDNIKQVDTENLVDMSEMFKGTLVTKLDLSGWDTFKVNNMAGAFENTRLEELNVKGWNTINVNDMTGMFKGLPNLKSLDLSDWNTINAFGQDKMEGMFADSNRISTLVLGENTELANNVGLVSPPVDNIYTGLWTNGETGTNAWTGTTAQLIERSQISNTKGTYTWETKDGVNPGATIVTISFDLAGGEGSFSPMSGEVGKEITLPVGVPTKDGYTFKGWEFEGEHYEKGATFTVPAEDATLVAQWEKEDTEKPAESIFVTFENGGENFNNTTVEVKDGEKLVFPEAGSKIGEEFVSWKDAAGKTYKVGSTYEGTLTDGMVFTGVWEAVEYVVSFDLNGGDGDFSDMTFAAGEAIKLPTDVPTKDNHKFLGWMYNGKVYAAGANFIVPFTNVALVAQWEEIGDGANGGGTTQNVNYELTFNLNGGKGTFSVITAKAGEKVSLPTAVPTKEGFKFKGWKYGKETELYAAKATFTMPEENAELVAQWEVNTKPTAPNSKDGKDAKVTEDLNKTGNNSHLGLIIGSSLLVAGGVAIAIAATRKNKAVK